MRLTSRVKTKLVGRILNEPKGTEDNYGRAKHSGSSQVRQHSYKEIIYALFLYNDALVYLG